MRIVFYLWWFNPSKNKSVEIALDSRKLNDNFIKMRPHMPLKEELLNQKSTKITKVQNEPLWIPKIDPKYAYGHLKSSGETSKHCYFAKTGGNVNWYWTFKKRFYGLCDIPIIFHEKIDSTRNYQTTVWLVELLIVTKGDKKHREFFFRIL